MTGRLQVSSPPSAGAVRRRVRARRRTTRSRAQRLGELYERLLYVGMVAGLAFQAVSSGLAPAARPAPSTVALTQWLVVAGALAAVGVTSTLMLAFGPMIVGPAEQTWLLSTPIGRRALLRPVFAVVVLLGAAAGSAVAVLVVVLAGLPAAALPGWLVSGAMVGVCQASVGVLLQRHGDRRRSTQTVLDVGFGLLAAWTIGLCVLGPTDPPLPASVGERWWVPAVAGLTLLACGAAAAAWRAAGLLTRAQLSSGVELAAATTTSATFLDPSILWSVALVRRTRAIGRVRSAAIRGSRTTALVRADLTRTLRLRTGLLLWTGLLPVPFVAGQLGATSTVPPIHLVAAFLAANSLAGGLRLTCRSAAVRRAVGGTDRQQRLAHLALPATGALVWTVVTAALAPGMSLVTGVVSFVGAVAVTYRMATRRPLDYSSPDYDIGLMGPVPPGLVLQLIRGPALLIVLALLQIQLADT